MERPTGTAKRERAALREMAIAIEPMRAEAVGH